MTRQALARRDLLLGAVTLAVTTALPVAARGAGSAMHVLRDPDCGCCSAWIELLEREGFTVTTESSLGSALMRYKLENGIPPAVASCHTGRIEGYMIEGHVPAADIRRLLAERPAAVGLAVPGMPYGSPGMGPEEEREAYDVLLIRKDGTIEIFTRYPAA